ncbi:trypsin-3-like [Colias croceus]|uniref:trypsin-3-like n=1 Tax=Colias crocea TaxID=72248 RepID=UPI001E27BBDA|nr:trypsin-3-like [Colias croceus]
MFKNFILFLLFGPWVAEAGAFQASIDPDTKIIGGEDAPEGAIPSLVSLRLNIYAESHFCFASIIRPTWVVTAAHCTVDLRDARIAVYITVVGTNKLSSGGDTYAVKQIINHPNFSDTTYVNDIALLEVAEEIQYYSKVAPMALPDEDTPANTTCVVSGWGFTDSDSGGPLAADGKLVGVASWGVGCASRYPEVYTRVFSYLDWILGIVDSNE